jgi:hypothetical protein
VARSAVGASRAVEAEAVEAVKAVEAVEAEVGRFEIRQLGHSKTERERAASACSARFSAYWACSARSAYWAPLSIARGASMTISFFARR